MAGQPIKTLIADDEAIARRILREGLEPFPDIQVVAEAEHGEAALREIELWQPDLVFLDYQMPGLDGFGVIRKLSRRIPAIVMVTAYDQHAIAAFELGALDYLLKPFSEERLSKTIERVRRLCQNPLKRAEQAAQILDAAPGKARKIVGQQREEYFLLDLDEILSFYAEGEIVWIVTAAGRYYATQTLRTLEAKLKNTQFRRVHRNALVNINHVRKMSALSSKRWLLTLSNMQELVASKRLAQNIRDLLHW